MHPRPRFIVPRKPKTVKKPKNVKNSLELKNLKAWVEVGGKNLDCHAIDIPNKRSREASCWIASEENKTFAVKLRKMQPSNWHCRVSLFLDGNRVDSTIVEKADSYTATFNGLATDESVRYFKFAPLNVTDEEEYRDAVILRPEARKIGEITLTVHRITNLKTTKHKKGDTSDSCDEDRDEEDSDKESVPQLQKVHESSFKAQFVPHQISFGDPISTKKDRPLALLYGAVLKDDHNTDYYQREWYCKRECLATFTFRYRPLHILVDGGIVPRRLLSNPGAGPSQHGHTFYESAEEEPNEDEEDDTDDGEFRGSPPSYFDTAAPRRASTRGLETGAPNGGSGGRVSYADYDSAELQEADSDLDDIYVRTDEEREMREAPARTQAQAEAEAPGGVTASASGREEPNTVATPTPGLTNAEEIHVQNPAASPPPTVAVPPTPFPAEDIQRPPSPVIRQESEQPNHEPNVLTMAQNADGHAKGPETPALVPTVSPDDEQSRKVKLEEIEKGVPSIRTIEETPAHGATGQMADLQPPTLMPPANPVDGTQRIKLEENEMRVSSVRADEGAMHHDTQGRTEYLQPPAPLPVADPIDEQDRTIKLEEIEMKPIVSSDDEDEEERELRLKLEAIKARKRKAKELQRAEAVKRVKREEESQFYFKPGEVIDLVSP